MIVVDKAGNESQDDWVEDNIVYEQPYTVSIRGRVIDSSGNPIYGVQVLAVARFEQYCDEDREICGDTTDANGNYAIAVNKDQDYNVTFYRPGYFMSKHDKGLYADAMGIYDDITINTTLNNLQTLKEWQTLNQTIRIHTDRIFERDGQRHGAYILVNSLSGEIGARADIYTRNIDITSLGRIAWIQLNDPEIKISSSKTVGPGHRNSTV